MLTKSDLNQIKGLFKDVATREDLNNFATKEDLKSLAKQSDLEIIKKDVKTIKSDTVNIRKDMKTVVSFFDREYLELRKRVERLEEVLKLDPLH